MFVDRRQPAEPFEEIVNGAVDDAQWLRALLGGKLAKRKVDRLWQAQRVGSRRRALAIGLERIATAITRRSSRFLRLRGLGRL